MIPVPRSGPNWRGPWATSTIAVAARPWESLAADASTRTFNWQPSPRCLRRVVRRPPRLPLSRLHPVAVPRHGRLVAKLLAASSGFARRGRQRRKRPLSGPPSSNALTREGILQRMAAAEELGRSGRTEAIERLTNYLGAEPHSTLAAAAARGLGGFGSTGSSVREPLETLLTEDDPELEVVGAMALGKLGLIESGPALSRVVERAAARQAEPLWLHSSESSPSKPRGLRRSSRGKRFYDALVRA